jgi:hypothetical protein
MYIYTYYFYMLYTCTYARPPMLLPTTTRAPQTRPFLPAYPPSLPSFLGFSSAAEYAATNAEAKGREVAMQLFKETKGRTTIVVGSDTVYVPHLDA